MSSSSSSSQSSTISQTSDPMDPTYADCLRNMQPDVLVALTLSHLKDSLRRSKADNFDLMVDSLSFERENGELKEYLASKESKIKELEGTNAALEEEVADLKARLEQKEADMKEMHTLLGEYVFEASRQSTTPSKGVGKIKSVAQPLSKVEDVTNLKRKKCSSSDMAMPGSVAHSKVKRRKENASMVVSAPTAMAKGKGKDTAVSNAAQAEA
ncbi:hypothetical protein CPB84DRAFT_1846402 [Gymnopilus junonius]|uniref:Uncharacterized protein n=1 Tax=Gymnopilus junonius TaxID=109634 RepID=A0A9P5NMI4_GYMJU|nr:hypothetical protein CPB84DRAFT_1846402 [Gymnopilus junonius]